jgi:type IV pilus assembly protein PilV
MDQLVRICRKRQISGESGLSMIEVLVAGFILTVGMLGFAVLMTTAISANSRSRADSTSIMLAQAVMDQLAASATLTPTTSISDCSGNPATTANVSSGGAALLTNDEIDWTASAQSGYSMTYVICASTNSDTSNAQQRSYDLRWRVAQVSASDTDTFFIVVGARPSKWNSNLKQFAMPISLKSYIGPHSATP